MRIAFLGGGDWAADCLDRLVGEGHEIVGVVPARRRADALRAAAGAAGVAVHAAGGASDPVLGRCLEAAELAVSVDYDRILPPALLALPEAGAINLHPGLLPRYRGLGVVTWAVRNGEPEIGVTVHHMDAGIDSGDIILQRRLPVGPDESAGDVVQRIRRTAPDLLASTVRLLAEGRAPRVPQDEAAATYYPAGCDADRLIDWAQDSQAVHDLVRALTRPDAGALTWLGDEPVVVWRTALRPGAPRYRCTPGVVVGRDPAGPVVKTGDRSILVLEAGPAGGQAAAAPPRWPLGTRLGLDLAALLLDLRGGAGGLQRRCG